MPIHAELVDLARMCAFNARGTLDCDAAAELWKMALEYQARAARLDGGKKPDIGWPPEHMRPR
jgi:hypothetical protein